MLMKNVWRFVIIAVLVAEAAPSSDISGDTQTKWPKIRRHRLSSRGVPPPATTFFAGDRRPENLPHTTDGTEIQQKLPNDPSMTTYFVTLFDGKRNIPIYSAYKVTPQQAAGIGNYSRVDSDWRNPKDAKGQGIPVDNAYKEAIKTVNLSRGHMNPSGINSFDENFMKATFTLTNAAPQFESSNSGPWNKYEDRIRQYAKCPCGNDIRGGTLYLLTGTSDYGLKPGGGGIPVQDTTIALPYTRLMFPAGVKLVTPRAVWTAGCCVWNEPGKIIGSYWQSAKAESFAVMSNNQDNPALLHQTEMSVAELEDLLTEPGTPKVNLFPGSQQCRNPRNPDFRLPI